MKWLHNRLTIFGLLLVIIAVGCSLVPGGSGYSTPELPEVQAGFIFNQSIGPDSETLFTAGDFSISIPRGAVEKNFLLQIRKTPINFTSLGLEEDYVQISPLYSLLTPEHAKLLKMPASITIGIDSILAANHLFVAERLDDKWRFLPCNIANSQISIDFSEFSEFVVLKRKSLETVADNAFPELKIT